jgi:hypothetical protein
MSYISELFKKLIFRNSSEGELKISCQIVDGVRTYLHTEGDFELKFVYDPKIDKDGFAWSEISYKRVLIERAYHQMGHISWPVQKYVRKKVAENLLKVRQHRLEILDRIAGQILSNEAFSGIDFLQVKSENRYGKDFDFYEICAYESVRRKSFYEIVMSPKFKPVEQAGLHPKFEVIDYGGELFIDSQFRLDNKSTNKYQAYNFGDIRECINKHLTRMARFSNLHIWGFKGDYELHGYSKSYFYYNVSEDSVLMILPVGRLPNNSSVRPTNVSFNVVWRANFKTRHVELDVYRYANGDIVDVISMPIESRFNDEGFDVEYYISMFIDVIDQLGVRFYPTFFTLKFLGVDDFNGELSEDQYGRLRNEFRYSVKVNKNWSFFLGSSHVPGKESKNESFFVYSLSQDNG